MQGWNPKDSPDDRFLLMDALVHSADLGHVTFDFSLNFQFSTLVGMEFKEQARKERELGLPVLSMMEETEVACLCLCSQRATGSAVVWAACRCVLLVACRCTLRHVARCLLHATAANHVACYRSRLNGAAEEKSVERGGIPQLRRGSFLAITRDIVLSGESWSLLCLAKSSARPWIATRVPLPRLLVALRTLWLKFAVEQLDANVEQWKGIAAGAPPPVSIEVVRQKYADQQRRSGAATPSSQPSNIKGSAANSPRASRRSSLNISPIATKLAERLHLSGGSDLPDMPGRLSSAPLPVTLEHGRTSQLSPLPQQPTPPQTPTSPAFTTPTFVPSTPEGDSSLDLRSIRRAREAKS